MKVQSPHAKVLIVNDHPLVREALAMRISTQPDLAVCGEAASEDEALQLMKETNPDLVIIDLSLRNGHGMELIKRTKSLHPAVKLLVFSAFQESLYAERALRAGALGYLNKQEGNQLLIEAVRAVLQGKRFVSKDITDRLVARALESADVNQEPVERLTDRELEIFRMIGQGLTNKIIAGRLHLSPHTIDSHRENIKRNSGPRTRSSSASRRRNGRWRTGEEPRFRLGPKSCHGFLFSANG